jgi:hypothetical protein
MRVNLITRPSAQVEAGAAAVPLSVTIRPACGVPGDYDCQIDSKSLLRMLRQQTDLPAFVLERFEEGLRNRIGAKLMGVDLNDNALTDIGYFID